MIKAASSYVPEGKTWIVDLDISAFFDEVDHDILMANIGRKIRDKRVLRLIGNYLGALMQRDGSKAKRSLGGSLSLLLATICLDELDKALEQRGLSFCRYADDVVVFVSSEGSGERILESLITWIGQHIKMRVNANKSGIGRPWYKKFLGFRITNDGRIEPSQARLDKLKAQERVLGWQRYIRDYWNYYRICQLWQIVKVIESWILRHMRKYFWQRWHNRRRRMNALRRLKAKPYHQKQASGSVSTWRNARSPMLQTVLNNSRLRRRGLWLPTELATL